MSAIQSGQASPAVKFRANKPAPCAADSATLLGRSVSSVELLRGGKSMTIEHQGVIYRLQVTKLGKLILTK